MRSVVHEPEESIFDFSELDKTILEARQHGLHLVLLWFGSYKNGKTWEQIFGSGNAAEEMFMAYSLATYIGKVPEAGKKEYAIPFFTNVWLNTNDGSILDLEGVPESLEFQVVAGGGARPGVYPSSGPCPHTLDIWKYSALALAFISPDVYLQEYEWACKHYRYENQPLLIPEQRADGRGSRQAWLAYGSYGALGCSPFGIDTIDISDNEFKRPYGLLAKVSNHILTAQARNLEDMFGFFFDEPSRTAKNRWTRSIGRLRLHVTRSFAFGKQTSGYGIIIHSGQGRFLLIGEGFQVKFESMNPDTTYTGILEFRELDVSPDGHLSKGRLPTQIRIAEISLDKAGMEYWFAMTRTTPTQDVPRVSLGLVDVRTSVQWNKPESLGLASTSFSSSFGVEILLHAAEPKVGAGSTTPFAPATLIGDIPYGDEVWKLKAGVRNLRGAHLADFFPRGGTHDAAMKMLQHLSMDTLDVRYEYDGGSSPRGRRPPPRSFSISGLETICLVLGGHCLLSPFVVDATLLRPK
ncbi:hypothetical protein H9Q74_007676 [Fusarium xylarioides]|nr:hypothetical protein H9Q71_007716 [Fusarium xylarioides]KAG5822229.1 hypothetical protein H9Q74_007676 [Fusarium xylarioides]